MCKSTKALKVLPLCIVARVSGGTTEFGRNFTEFFDSAGIMDTLIVALVLLLQYNCG